MRDLLISINSNNLKISYCGPEGCGGISSEISKEIVKDTKILDKERFTEDLISLSNEILPKGKKPDGLNFLLSPEDAYVSFITVNKNDGELEEQIMSSIKEKIDVSIDDLYFSYSKIAPFVYQFVGISKDYMEDLMEVATLWGIPINAVIPWVLLLPKTLQDADPAIFVANIEDKHVVSLSELNGIYFASSYDKQKTSAELEELVKTLSVYNRKSPIKRIFTLNSSISLDNDYETLPVFKGEEKYLSEGFEVHELYLHILQNNRDLLTSCINLLNLLPLPEPSTLSTVMVPAALSILLVSVLFGGYLLFFQKSETDIESVAGVASGEIETIEQTTPVENPEPEESQSSEESQELVKSDLEIRVENAAGINGAAGRTQALLEESGYTVVSIDTAENMRETTQILISQEKQAFRDVLLEDLGENYPEAVTDILEDPEASYDVLILLGRNTTI